MSTYKRKRSTLDDADMRKFEVTWDNRTFKLETHHWTCLYEEVKAALELKFAFELVWAHTKVVEVRPGVKESKQYDSIAIRDEEEYKKVLASHDPS